MQEVEFRNYLATDIDACLALFDANCPAFFAPNERLDYSRFLNAQPRCYEVCEVENAVAGAFGLVPVEGGRVNLNWIMLNPLIQRLGIGSKIMNYVIEQARARSVSVIYIAASHKSEPFFNKFGGKSKQRIEHGWGQDMHRVNMELELA